MATPVGHALVGASLGFASSRNRPNVWWLLFAAFAACAPDLDFLPGLVAGDINLYHQLASHSFTAMILFGAFCGVVGGYYSSGPGRFNLRVAASAALFYGSHLVIDLFTTDTRAPFGIPLFWPFYNGHFMAPWTPFGGVRHGVPGDSLMVFLGELFSMHNLAAIGIEVVVLGPTAVAIWWLGRRRARRT